MSLNLSAASNSSRLSSGNILTTSTQSNSAERKKPKKGTKRLRASDASSSSRASLVPKKAKDDMPDDETDSVAGSVREYDGRVMGHSIKAAERDIIEDYSTIIYPYPRFTNGREGEIIDKRTRNKRMLDLILEGEIDDEKKYTGSKYFITGILSLNKIEALVNWHGFKYPTWQPREDINAGGVFKTYKSRMEALDVVIRNLCMTETDIITNYPNMSLKRFTAFGEYVKNPGLLYISGLYKRELQINDLLERSTDLIMNGNTKEEPMPKLIFADFTDFEHSSIPNFEYVAEPVMTADVVNIEKELEFNANCCSCLRCETQDSCCLRKSETKSVYVKRMVIGNLERPIDDEHPAPKDCVDVYECGDACACDRKRCKQRAVQRGHRNTLVVFRHHAKGWTLRCGHKLEIGAFVCAYTGVMMTPKEACNRVDKTYHLEMKVQTTSSGPRGRSIVIDSEKKGNEARFIAHSCEPNLFAFRVHFDIKGRVKRRVAFFAARNIEAGEELTFDYYKEDVDPVKFHKRTELAGFVCACGSSKCRETAYQKKMKDMNGVKKE